LLAANNEFEIRFSPKNQNGQFNMVDIYLKNFYEIFNFYEIYLDVFSVSDKSEYNPNLN